MEIDIYYKLVLSNGDAYKRSSVDRATVKHDADIIHLRDAVKLKNPQIPSTVGAAQLTVYATLQDLLDPARLPLDPRQALDSVIEYLVVVPDIKQGTTDLQPPPGKNNFFNKI